MNQRKLLSIIRTHIPLLFLVGVLFASGLSGWWQYSHALEDIVSGIVITEDVDPLEIVVDKFVHVESGSTYGQLMDGAGVADAESTAIYNAAHEIYDLASVRVGRDIRLTYDITGETLLGLLYQTDSEQELHVTKDENSQWTAALVDIEYVVEVHTAEGTITDSLYAAGLASGLDEATIVTLAGVFEWSVDFAMDIRTGDSYKFVYEKRFRNGEYVMAGNVLAGKFVNAGYEHYAFYYEGSDGKGAHYDEDGNSVQKMFLKAPVSFKYISSGFTTGRRYVAAFNTSTGHRAIDYAAAYGTPIRTVGAGTVVRAGWNGSYGNFVSIRHNGTYTTNYAHMSRYAVGYGERVSQGQTIGYVGSTGFSTGPHLHYEMVKHGVKINPMREVLPPGKPIAGEELDRFLEVAAGYMGSLE